MTGQGDALDSGPLHRRDLLGLDGIRGVAVLLVVLYHCAGDLPPGNFLRPIAEVGSFGVIIFFVLSGYLITQLLLREEGQSGRVELGRFYLRRALRILPPAYFLIAALAVFDRSDLLRSPVELASCLLFFRNYVAPGAAVTIHLWSLAVEEHFYLVWPAVFVVCRSTTSRLWVVGIAVAWAPIWRRIAIALAGGPESVNWFRTDLRYDGLLMGCLLALLSRVTIAERWLGSRPMQHSLAPILAIVALACSFQQVFVALPLAGWVGPSFQYVCVAVVLNQVVRRPEGILTRLLEATAIARVGRLSYSIYLWQQPFTPSTWPKDSSSTIHLPLNLLAIVAFSTLSYYVAERPFFTLRARFRNRPKPGSNGRSLGESVFVMASPGLSPRLEGSIGADDKDTSGTPI